MVGYKDADVAILQLPNDVLNMQKPYAQKLKKPASYFYLN